MGRIDPEIKSPQPRSAVFCILGLMNDPLETATRHLEARMESGRMGARSRQSRDWASRQRKRFQSFAAAEALADAYYELRRQDQERYAVQIRAWVYRLAFDYEDEFNRDRCRALTR